MKRQREKSTLNPDTEYVRNFTTTIMREGITEITNMVFALLRDRPYMLIKIYRELGLASIDPSKEEGERQKVTIILQTIFKKLWFLSYKDVFPDELICAFEYDYIIKNKIDPKIIKNEPSLKPFVLSLQFVLNIIEVDKNNEPVYSYLSQFYNSQPNDSNKISVLNFYINCMKKIEVDSKDENVHLITFLEDIPTELSVRKFFGTMDLEDTILYMSSTEKYMGFHIKMRRIFYKLNHDLVEKLYKLINDVKKIIKSIDNNKFISMKLDQTITDMSKYNNTIAKYLENNPYTPNEEISFNKKAAYFNHFDILIKSIPRTIDAVPEKDGYKENVIKLFDNFIYEITHQTIDEIPSFLYNIINEVEKEINFPDHLPFKLYIQDNLYADKLLIDTKNNFKWFYSYYDKQLNKIVDMTNEEINHADKVLSLFWFTSLNVRILMLEMKEEENILKYSNKLTI